MLRFLRGGGRHTKTIWWAIAIITVVTFIGGFVFLFGAGIDPTRGARATGAVAVVNGDRVSHVEFENELAQERDAYRRQFGSDPAERDQKMIETQAWRTLVTEELVTQQARALGLRATDQDVSIAMKTNPPAIILQAPDFQTDGKFDAHKYQAALGNPNINWSGFEAVARQQVPMRKLEERLLSSIKVSEDELRQAFRDRYDRIDATFLALTPAPDAKVPPPTEAQLQQTYERYKGRFSSGLRVQLEVLRIPKKYGDEDLRDARELAKSLVDRARKGEKFEDLARDFSEGPNAQQGGELPRPVSMQELGPEIGARVASAQPGDVLDPMQDAGRFVILKLLGRTPAGPGGAPQFRIAQIIVKVKPNDTLLRQQFDDTRKLRDRAASTSLAEAAASKGLATFKTSFFDYNSPPSELYTVPEAVEWGLGAKKGEVSPVFEGIDEFVVCQVSTRHEGGPAPRTEIAEPVRQLAELDEKVDALKGRADAIARTLAGGSSLEDAARAEGLQVVHVTGMSRATPDPRIASAPEVVGATLASPPGRVVGPVRAVGGWYFGRLDHLTAAADTTFARTRVDLTREILQRRQQAFFMGLMSSLRARANVKDLRPEQY